MIKYFFKVESSKTTPSTPLAPGTSLLFGSILRFCMSCFVRCFKNSKHARTKRILAKAENQLESYLDIRTMLRMQSLITVLSRVVLEKKHRTLLRHQKHARTVYSQTSSSCDEVLYESEEAVPPFSDLSYEPTALSPRSQVLHDNLSRRWKTNEISNAESAAYE